MGKRKKEIFINYRARRRRKQYRSNSNMHLVFTITIVHLVPASPAYYCCGEISCCFLDSFSHLICTKGEKFYIVEARRKSREQSNYICKLCAKNMQTSSRPPIQVKGLDLFGWWVCMVFRDFKWPGICVCAPQL